MTDVDDSGYVQMKSGVPVDLRVAAQCNRLPVVRAVAQTVAVLDGCTPDETADLTLAVEEVCSRVMAAAIADTAQRCTFAVSDAGVRVTVGGCLRDGVLGRGGVGWQLLSTVTDALWMSEDPVRAPGAGERSRSSSSRPRGGPPAV